MKVEQVRETEQNEHGKMGFGSGCKMNRSQTVSVPLLTFFNAGLSY